MMLRYELEATQFPKFNSNKIDSYVETILQEINDGKKQEEIFNKLTNSLNHLNIDWSSKEISKSADLTEKCKALYKKA